jgi:hypothetical protein
MKTAANNALVLVAAAAFGLVLAMALPQSSIADNSVTLDGISANLIVASNQSELVSSVDWSKIQAEPASPTF